MKKLIFGALLLGVTTFSFAKTTTNVKNSNAEISTILNDAKGQKTVLTLNAENIKSIDELKESLSKQYAVKTTDIYIFILEDGTVIVIIVQY